MGIEKISVTVLPFLAPYAAMILLLVLASDRAACPLDWVYGARPYYTPHSPRAKP